MVLKTITIFWPNLLIKLWSKIIWKKVIDMLKLMVCFENLICKNHIYHVDFNINWCHHIFVICHNSLIHYSIWTPGYHPKSIIIKASSYCHPSGILKIQMYLQKKISLLFKYSIENFRDKTPTYRNVSAGWNGYIWIIFSYTISQGNLFFISIKYKLDITSNLSIAMHLFVYLI